MKIYPEGCKVLVEADKVEEKTKGGLFLPETTKDSEQLKVTRGTVLEIGPDARAKFNDDGEERHFRIGDRIIYAKYGGFRITDEKEKDLRLINDEDILAMIKE